MLFWKNKVNPWAEAAKARKNPPILITMLLNFAIFWGYMYLSNLLRGLIFKGISALLVRLIESGVMENSQYAIYDDMNVIAYSLTFILLVPIAIAYMKFIEGRSIKTVLSDGDDAYLKLLGGFAIGTVILAAILGFLSFFKIFVISGAGDAHWLSLLLGFISVALMSYGIEYYFRGFLLSSFGARNHPLAAIFASAVLYAVCMYFYFNTNRSLNIYLILDHLLLGILLGIITCRTRSIWTAVGIRFAIALIAQLVLGIPLSGYTYVHSLFASKYTTASIWFTTSTVQGVDTGCAMFSVLVIAVLLALFLPAAKKKDEAEKKLYFRHVGPEAAAPASEPTIPAAKPAASAAKPAAPASKPAAAPAPEPEADDEDWEEEQTRDVSTPQYKKPEDYLKQ